MNSWVQYNKTCLTNRVGQRTGVPVKRPHHEAPRQALPALLAVHPQAEQEDR